MQQVELVPVNLDASGNRQPGEELVPRRVDEVPVQRPHRGGEFAKSAAALGKNPLSHRMIMIASYGGLHMVPHPIDARHWVGAVVDEVTQE